MINEVARKPAAKIIRVKYVGVERILLPIHHSLLISLNYGRASVSINRNYVGSVLRNSFGGIEFPMIH